MADLAALIQDVKHRLCMLDLSRVIRVIAYRTYLSLLITLITLMNVMIYTSTVAEQGTDLGVCGEARAVDLICPRWCLGRLFTSPSTASNIPRVTRVTV